MKNKKFTLNDNENGDLVGLGLRISNKIAKWLNFSNQGIEYDSNSDKTVSTVIDCSSVPWKIVRQGAVKIWLY